MADKGVDAMFPASNLSIELAGGQVAVITGFIRTPRLSRMAEQQQAGAIPFSAGVGQRW
ncbi:hypothetical protein D3C78_1842720 [compost metagenome]